MSNAFFVPEKVVVGNIELNIADSFTYLGQIINMNGDREAE